MVKIDRIEHIVTIPEGVTASISEDGVVTIAGPKGSLSREFVSTRIDLLQDGSGLLVRTDLPRRKDKALAGLPICIESCKACGEEYFKAEGRVGIGADPGEFTCKVPLKNLKDNEKPGKPDDVEFKLKEWFQYSSKEDIAWNCEYYCPENAEIWQRG